MTYGYPLAVSGVPSVDTNQGHRMGLNTFSHSTIDRNQ